MLYPNPRNGKLIVQTKTMFLNGSAVLSNAAGQALVEEEVYQNVFELDMAHLPAGIYWLKITGLNGKASYEKVLKV